MAPSPGPHAPRPRRVAGTAMMAGSRAILMFLLLAAPACERRDGGAAVACEPRWAGRAARPCTAGSGCASWIAHPRLGQVIVPGTALHVRWGQGHNTTVESRPAVRGAVRGTRDRGWVPRQPGRGQSQVQRRWWQLELPVCHGLLGPSPPEMTVPRTVGSPFFSDRERGESNTGWGAQTLPAHHGRHALWMSMTR